ncbi:MAG: ABC transporter substrate-binding protein, partial [Chloroflexota bacterium]
EDDDEDDEEDDEGGDGEPVEGGVFIAMGHHEVASLSPDDWGPSVHFFIVGNLHDPLMQLDPWFELQPTLAESFDISDDALEYTFTLREGLLWHDETPLTANDVAYTFNYYGDEDNAAATLSNYDGMNNAEAVDERTVVVTMDRPNAAFLARAGQAGLVQEAHHSEIGEDAYKADPIGCGPWKLVEWRAAEFTELERFEDYWEGAPHMDGIRENIVPEASVRGIALENQEADSAVWPLLTDDHIKFMEEEDFSDYTVNVTSAVSVNHFMINNSNPMFQDKRVRQAMMYALDREAIRDDLWQGLAVLATANLSPALDYYYNPDVKQYEYDPDRANELLDEAGWEMGEDGIREREGERLSWVCTVITGDQARTPEAELAQANFLEVGMEMEIEQAPLATIQEGQRAGEIDMTLYNWTYGGGSDDPDGSNTLRSDARNNWSLWQNERIDELCDMGLAETEPEARREIYFEIQEIVAEEVPFLFVKFWDWFNIFTPRVKGVPEDPLTGDSQYQMLHKMWIEE